MPVVEEVVPLVRPFPLADEVLLQVCRGEERGDGQQEAEHQGQGANGESDTCQRWNVWSRHQERNDDAEPGGGESNGTSVLRFHELEPVDHATEQLIKLAFDFTLSICAHRITW